MKSEIERAASFIDSLSDTDQIRFLARLIYELTLAGRACYAMDDAGLDRPIDLRTINELQHNTSAQIMNIGVADGHCLPSSILAALFLEPGQHDDSLAGELRRSFMDALAASSTGGPAVADDESSGISKL